jgi:hypothetical protein
MDFLVWTIKTCKNIKTQMKQPNKTWAEKNLLKVTSSDKTESPQTPSLKRSPYKGNKSIKLVITLVPQ